jgi:hypothetical protein
MDKERNGKHAMAKMEAKSPSVLDKVLPLAQQVATFPV